MAEVNLGTLVCSAQCDFQCGGSISTSVFSSAALSSPRTRTVELHDNSVLYLFEEPVKSMAKHLREKIYVQGCHVLDVGTTHERECLALFLCDCDYAERVDDLGNVKGLLFTKAKLAIAPAVVGTSSLQPESKMRQETVKGSFMVLLHVADKKTKWRMLKAVQRYSFEYPAFHLTDTTHTVPTTSAPVGAVGEKERAAALHGEGAVGSSGAAVAPMVRNKFAERLGGSAAVASQMRTGEGVRCQAHGEARSSSESSAATVLSDHEVLQLEDVLRSFDERAQSEAPRVGSFAGSGDAAGRSSGRPVAEAEEELLPEESTSVVAVAHRGAATTATTASPVAVSASGSLPIADGDAGVRGGSPTYASSSSDATGLPARLLTSPLYATCIEGRQDNKACADCGDAFPTWCVLRPFGAFVCINCVGVHRRLWSNKCREVEMDKWPAEDVRYMATRGNQVVNDELEFCLAYPVGSVSAALGKVVAKPNGRHTPAAARAEYIQHKYEERLFAREQHPEATTAAAASTDGSLPGGAGSPASPTSPPSPSSLRGDGKVGGVGTASVTDAALAVTESLIIQLATSEGADEGPPQYCGLGDLLIKELVTPSESHPGAICTITNGFQALRTKPGRRLVNMPTSTAWDEHVQVGVERVEKPLYCAVYSAKAELLAAAEFYLPSASVAEPGQACMAAVEMPWCQLNKKASARRAGEVWQVTMLASFRPLA